MNVTKGKKAANPFDKKIVLKVLVPVKLHYSLDAGRRLLDLRELPTCNHRYFDQQKALTLVHRFLCMLHVRPTYAKEPGVTWIELMIVFEVHGGKLENRINERAAEDMARPARTTRQLLDLFKGFIRFILETCSSNIDAILFRTSHVNGTRLRALAVQHAMPSLNFVPIWNNEVAYLITQAVLRQKGKMTKAMVNAHEQGTLEIPWSNLSTKGIPSWRAATSQGPHFLLQHESSIEHTGSALPPELFLPNSSDHFVCPKCAATRSVEGCSLLVRSGWGHILCATCKITSRSFTWHCECGVPWHSCSVHAHRIRKPPI